MNKIKSLYHFLLGLLSVLFVIAFYAVMLGAVIGAIGALVWSVVLGVVALFQGNIVHSLMLFGIVLCATVFVSATINWGVGLHTILAFIQRVFKLLGKQNDSKRANPMVGKDGVFKNG